MKVTIDVQPHNPDYWKTVVLALREYGCYSAADQVEEQTRPKPVEPTGLGAVVVDDRGEYYVGLGDHYGTGQLRWKGDRGMTFTSYDRINAVRVLSEGVQP